MRKSWTIPVSDVINTKGAAQRLKEARKMAGFRTAKAFADAMLEPNQKATYYAHESGQRAIRVPVANQYAEAMGTTAQAILFGEDDRTATGESSEASFTVHPAPAPGADYRDELIRELRNQLHDAREREQWLKQHIEKLMSADPQSRLAI